MWPPPNWEEVVVTWEWIMATHKHDINLLARLVQDHPGGNYHLHGKGERHDFAFQFEQHYNVKFGTLKTGAFYYTLIFSSDQDYTMFMLRWS